MLQSATVGKGINIIMMGDGYIAEEMVKEIGKYEHDMRTTTEHLVMEKDFGDRNLTVA